MVRTGALVGLATCALLAAGCGGKDEPAQPPSGAGAQAAASSAAQGTTPPSYTPTGPLVAESDFRPERNGFGFENYTTGYEDLTPTEMVDLFGPQVCASGSGADCQLTPPAQTWMESMNKAMDGGHCFGFSVTALMMYQHLLDPLSFGGPSPPALPLAGNATLQRRIAESWVLQVLPNLIGRRIEGTPNGVLDAIVADLKEPKETYTLGIFKRDFSVGHAVTPYAVEDRGGGKFAVLIYDNNYPLITRAIEFDRNADTWSYEASANPQAQSFLYDGDANTNNAWLEPTTPGVGIQACPFCAPGPGPQTQGAYEQVQLSGDSVTHAHVVLTDSAGRKTGYVNGKLVNDIPGARVIPLALAQNWRESPEPLFLVPRAARATITLDGSHLGGVDQESLAVIGPGYAAVAGNLVMRPGQRDQMRVERDATSVVYRTASGQPQRPQLQIGVQRPGGDVRFAVTSPELAGGSAVTVRAAPARGKVALNATTPGRYTLSVTRLPPSGGQTTRGRAVQLPAGGSTALRFAP